MDSETLFWFNLRRHLLGILDEIEKKLGIHPRTAELRRLSKDK